MTSIYNDQRQHMKHSFASGAVDHSFVIESAVEIWTMHITFDAAPASEDVTISIIDGDGDIMQHCAFNPTDENTPQEVTSAFQRWGTTINGGTVRVQFANTNNVSGMLKLLFQHNLFPER